MSDVSLALPTLSLMFVLGLRHGLDPDHVAVIDNIVFRMVDERPRLSPWTGTLFALGHSLAVAGVAVGVAAFARRLAMPPWFAPTVDIAVILLLAFVGSLNLAALLRRRPYAPVGWRAGLIPARLRTSTHPAALVAVGIVFGLVFDTATQAAAWGAAATTQGGLAAIAGIIIAFAAGMILADTLDSQIVSRLLRSRDSPTAVIQRYRRAVGWLIVALSYGMALFALLEISGHGVDIDDTSFTLLGAGGALGVVILLGSPHAWTRMRGQAQKP
ncbi:nickel permease [Nitrospirillum iridis]|uniref:Nickel/cobalt efflux system n=1 Tax=Nitrospirillum iridis TaxID=765888 RepID=A0A7X0B5J5_9PROT|nr:nickel permease [Nitrospirillum iridis]MBB6254589.1 high-affinity nickel-transport protein [Nitrospirillum iridis]